MLRQFAKIIMLVMALWAAPATTYAQGAVSQTYSGAELLTAGEQFFGSISQGLAAIVERAVSQFGEPNAYILGQEGSAAFFGGVRYGDGEMYTRNAGQHELFWQGPTIGLDRKSVV